MAQHFIDRFVRINDVCSVHHLQRGQVVGSENMTVAVRFADGEHEFYGMSMVKMDTDQQTPVWPPPDADREIVVPEIKVGDFVRVTNLFMDNERCKLVRRRVADLGDAVVSVQRRSGQIRGVSPDRMVRDDDQTTPLDATTTDQPTQ